MGKNGWEYTPVYRSGSFLLFLCSFSVFSQNMHCHESYEIVNHRQPTHLVHPIPNQFAGANPQKFAGIAFVFGYALSRNTCSCVRTGSVSRFP